MNTREMVIKKITNYLSEEFSLNADSINLDDEITKFEEFGLNSIYFVKILIDLEKIFNISFIEERLL